MTNSKKAKAIRRLAKKIIENQTENKIKSEDTYFWTEKITKEGVKIKNGSVELGPCLKKLVKHLKNTHKNLQ